ncbi:MAG: lysylphosphatidylglycerol synthase transmembrane domain-containing protein [Roseinatronobacter sp.]
MNWIVRSLVTLVLLGVVIWLVAPHEIAAAFRAVDPLWLAVAVLFLLLQIGLSSLRWHVTAQAFGFALPKDRALQEYGLSVAVNTFLPGGVLGDLARIARSRSFGWRGAAASVLIERLAGQVALALVALGAGVAVLGPARGGALVIAAIVAGTILLWLWPRGRTLLKQAWFAPRVWQAQAALTCAILLFNLGGFWAAARAVGVHLSPGTALILISLTLLSMLIPLTINGWGLREGTAAALWPLWGIGAAQAVAASVAFGLACMGAALLGLLPWLLRRRLADEDIVLSARAPKQ